MVRVFYSQKTEQLIKKLEDIKDLSPEARLLGYNFSVVIQNRDSDTALRIIEHIENLPTIWKK